MNTTKKNLLQRVRVIMIALVAIIGVGGVMAMKPAKQIYLYKYGVRETSDGLSWVVVANTTTTQEGLDYDCNTNVNNPACTIFSNDMKNNGDHISKNPALVDQKGDFNQ